MKVGEGRNFGIPQESRLHIEFSADFPAATFFNGWTYYDAFFEVL